jgi:hypothetical protein
MKEGELIFEHPHRIAIDGATYRVLVYGARRKDGTWSGSLEFRDVSTNQTVITGQETSQPDRKALEYWATGVEDVYLEGALRRAH